MLTADLALSWQRGQRTGPRYIDVADATSIEDASDLIELFRRHEGNRRAELEQALQEYVGVGTDYKILRGLIKLLMDRCVFETGSEIEPALIRQALFLRARANHPVMLSAEAREQVLSDVAKELGCAPFELVENLYADLPLNQKLVEFDAPVPEDLLDEYNLAQAQALLYRCVEMRIEALAQDTKSYRELFGAIKSYRLIHTVKGNPSRGYEIRLNGPVSMFHRSQKYGVQMAVFLPALLICKDWRMRAEITSKTRGNAFFELDSKQNQLRSPQMSIEPYENPALGKFAADWQRIESEWTLEESKEVIDLGESAFIPDFVLRHQSGKQIYLEVLGFWTPQHLKARLKEFEHSGFKDFIIAAWDELRGSRDPLTKIPPNVIVFKRSLDPIVVQLEIEKDVNREA